MGYLIPPSGSLLTPSGGHKRKREFQYQYRSTEGRLTPKNWQKWIYIFFCLCIQAVLGGGNNFERLPRITEHPSNLTVPKNDPVTLKCRAEGNPDPVLVWYKDGERVQPSTHRVFLPTGALFFLGVSQNKKDSDAGTYWCEAINRVGRVRSRNASLQIAFLRDDFRVSPTGGRVVAGEKADLDCVPPRGFPAPQVTWEKDGNEITISDRLYYDNGKLIIRETLQTDEGKYVCKATNKVGTKSSRPAILAVLVRPFFVRLPSDVTGMVGMNVRLECRAGGAPRPHVLWRRHDGRMPIGRARLAQDNALEITSLVIEDAGVYICQAENDVATVVANATLVVLDPPTIINGPENAIIFTNTTLKLPCKGKGAPHPLPMWTMASKPKPFGPGWSSVSGRISDDGTLELTPLSEEDGGVYTCLMVSESGGTHSFAHLTVISPRNAPPPTFITKPSNQTLVVGEPATFYCRAQGPPSPHVAWLKGSKPLRVDNNRIKMTKQGDLFFEEVILSDSGTFVCLVTSATGESRATVSMIVVPSRSHLQGRQFMPHAELQEVPPPPSRPRLIEITNGTGTLMWHPGQLQRRDFNERTATLDYTIEVSVQGGPWQIAASHIPTTTYTALLRTGVAHIFAIRARGSQGVSAPSTWSPLIVGGEAKMEPESPFEGSNLNLTSVSAASSRSLKITWEITNPSRPIDGLYVHHRPIWKPVHALHLTHYRSRSSLPSYPISYGSNDPPWGELEDKEYISWGTVTVLNAGASSYVLTRLEPNTLYQVFLVPFRGSHSGPPSSILFNATTEEAPAGPPTEITVKLVNASIAKINWRPPKTKFIHGGITNYRILVMVNESSVYLNKTVNSSTFLYLLSNLIPGHTYSIRVFALSKKGSGPSSKAIRLQTDSSLLNPLANRHAGTEGVVSVAWFIVLVGGAMFFLLLILVILVFIRRYSNKSSKLPTMNGSVTKTSNLANFYGGENLWSEAGWQGNQNDLKSDTKIFVSREQRELLASLAPEYAEIDSLGTFGGIKKQNSTITLDDKASEAYASASILANCNGRRSKNSHLSKQERNKLSQDVLNNTDTEEKHLLDSKRPFFIETSSPPILPPVPITFNGSSRVISGNRTATLGPYATSHRGKIYSKGVSPYSVNTFTSQPHLLQKGITLNLKNFVPPPPDRPPPNQAYNHMRHNFSRTKTMEELPYACYSSTQVASPMLARAASLEGRASPYAPSSATYQSIEGLTEGMAEFRDDCHRCNNCGSRASTISQRASTISQRAKGSRCSRHHNQHRHYDHGGHYHPKSRQCSSSRSSNSSSQPGVHGCCRTPVSQSDFVSAPCSYTPNFYGWMSPPATPRDMFPPFECEGVSLDGESTYGGSARSENGGEYSWCRNGGGSFYGGSMKSEEEELQTTEEVNCINNDKNSEISKQTDIILQTEENMKRDFEKEVIPSPTKAEVSEKEIPELQIDHKKQNDEELLSPANDTDLSTLLASCDKQTKL